MERDRPRGIGTGKDNVEGTGSESRRRGGYRGKG